MSSATTASAAAPAPISNHEGTIHAWLCKVLPAKIDLTKSIKELAAEFLIPENTPNLDKHFLLRASRIDSFRKILNEFEQQGVDTKITVELFAKIFDQEFCRNPKVFNAGLTINVSSIAFKVMYTPHVYETGHRDLMISMNTVKG